MILVSTPCNRICSIDPESGLCVGCGRTRDEIAAWGRLGEPERQRIMRLCEARPRPALEAVIATAADSGAA